jgi:hypothetical protein
MNPGGFQEAGINLNFNCKDIMRQRKLICNPVAMPQPPEGSDTKKGEPGPDGMRVN